MAQHFDDVEQCVDVIIDHVGDHIIAGIPLGLGKPNAIINALYQRAKQDASLKLELYTALSLEIPKAKSLLEKRFLEPFVSRHFGENYPELEYPRDVQRGTVPDNITVSEFYMQSGRYLGVPYAQRHYTSTNYTHVARDMADRGCNLLLQLVGANDTPAGTHYSLGSNPDVSLDLITELERKADKKLLVVGQVNWEMPFMGGDAETDEAFFDLILEDAAYAHTLFAPPKASINTADYMIGLYVSTLVKDCGTLQIGIGSLGDAFVYAAELRHRDNERYRKLVSAAGIQAQFGETVNQVGDLSPFEMGLYGASEMFMDGFQHLYDADILKRRVFDDVDLQRQINRGERKPPENGGAILHAAFFLGSAAFYEWLNDMPQEERDQFQMTRVGRINELYGGEELDRAQRINARFINTAMKMTLLGAAVSDGLDHGQVVSGVGGQYNFVAMAHALPDSRSILMIRSTRQSREGLESNVVLDYDHVTIPRHLRDMVITEYGIADLRGRSDEECIQAMLEISDSRFQESLLNQAREAGKIDPHWEIPETFKNNLPQRLEQTLKPFRDESLFPAYPYGSDFTEVEQFLVKALGRLKSGAREPFGRVKLMLSAIAAPVKDPRIQPALERMGFGSVSGLGERFYRRVLASALVESL